MGASAAKNQRRDVFNGVFRASGVCWIASRPRTCGVFEFNDDDEEEEEEEEEENDDDDDDDVCEVDDSVETAASSALTRRKNQKKNRVITVSCGGAWDTSDRGACETPSTADALDRRVANALVGDRRQQLVFEGFKNTMDVMKIKECLDACLLNEDEDADEVNHGSDWKWYCGTEFPSASEVMSSAGLEVIDRSVKHKVFFPPTATVTATVTPTPTPMPLTTATVTTPAAQAGGSNSYECEGYRLGGEIGIQVKEAFEIPRTDTKNADHKKSFSKVFPSGETGHYFPDMPCLACGSPWWFGEDWNSKCANCGADDRCYGADQQPIRAYRRRYAQFALALQNLSLLGE